MGTWGTGIFSDDLACDIRDDWRDAILDGLDPQAATAKLEQSYRQTISDTDESTTFWIALAAAQWDTGRLQEHVRDRALDVIRSGADLKSWEPYDVKLRARSLELLVNKLKGPARKPKVLRRLSRIAQFALGDVIRLTPRDAHRGVLFAVVDRDEDRRGDVWDPVLEAFLWEAPAPPDKREAERAPALLSDAGGLIVRRFRRRL